MLQNSKSIKTKMRLLEVLKLMLLFFLSAVEVISSLVIFGRLGACDHNVSNFLSYIRSLEVMRKFRTVQADSTVLMANRMMYIPKFAIYNFC